MATIGKTRTIPIILLHFQRAQWGQSDEQRSKSESAIAFPSSFQKGQELILRFYIGKRSQRRVKITLRELMAVTNIQCAFTHILSLNA